MTGHHWTVLLVAKPKSTFLLPVSCKIGTELILTQGEKEPDSLGPSHTELFSPSLAFFSTILPFLLCLEIFQKGTLD
jgi:hypothetical protein